MIMQFLMLHPFVFQMLPLYSAYLFLWQLGYCVTPTQVFSSILPLWATSEYIQNARSNANLNGFWANINIADNMTLCVPNLITLVIGCLSKSVNINIQLNQLSTASWCNILTQKHAGLGAEQFRHKYVDCIDYL